MNSVVFSCCVRHFRPKQEDHTADNDCRWKAGARTGTFSRGDHHESDDYPGGLRPPIFYLDSGDSTDTDAPNPLQTIRQEQLPNTGNPCNWDNCLVRKANDNTEGADQAPKILSTGKKIPPKKPKRKNPPSNASSAASRRAITTCLTPKREREVVSSSESDCHSDVDRQSVFHDGSRMNKSL